ncbi:MAG: hypothetical protein ACREHE_13660 [Rhizomicrobium sp.]
MMARRILTLYAAAFAALLVAASVQTLLSAEGIAGHGHVAMLAAAEVAAALVLAWPPTRYAGGIVLLAILLLAQILTIAAGRRSTHLLQYAISVVLILALDRVLPRAPRMPV